MTRHRLVLAAAVLAAGCGSSPSAPGRDGLTGTLTVFAASSLTATFTQLGKAFGAAHPGTTVRFSFGPSSALAQQILAGAPADLFASASPRNMTQVTDAGDATGVRPFARNAAEVAVAPGAADTVTSLADLGRRGVRVALCQPAAPCGVLAHRVLAAAGVTVKPVTLGLDVKSTLAYVTTGQVDAAIVYVTDVLAAGGKVEGVQIPASVNASTAYEIARVRSGSSASLAAAFEEFVLSAAGQQVLTAAGFQQP